MRFSPVHILGWAWNVPTRLDGRIVMETTTTLDQRNGTYVVVMRDGTVSEQVYKGQDAAIREAVDGGDEIILLLGARRTTTIEAAVRLRELYPDNNAVTTQLFERLLKVDPPAEVPHRHVEYLLERADRIIEEKNGPLVASSGLTKLIMQACMALADGGLVPFDTADQRLRAESDFDRRQVDRSEKDRREVAETQLAEACHELVAGLLSVIPDGKTNLAWGFMQDKVDTHRMLMFRNSTGDVYLGANNDWREALPEDARLRFNTPTHADWLLFLGHYLPKLMGMDA